MSRSTTSRLTRGSLFVVILAGLLTSLHARPQSAPAPRAMSPDQLDAILSSQSRARTVTQVAVSPDGKRVAWLQAGEIRVASLDNLLRSQEITGQSCAASEFVWSPNSASIAFLSDCDESGQPNLFLSHLDSSAALRLTDLHGYVNAPAFSPDSRSIAFLYVEGATRPAGALAAEPLPSGVIGEDHIEIQRVAAISAELSSSADRSQPAAPGFLTPPNLHIFEFDWSPDSRSLAYIAADPPGENNWWVAKLYTQSIAFPTNMGAGAPGSGSPRTGPSPWGGDPSRLGTGGSPTPILSPSEISGPLHGLQIALPRWSPDGKSIAFIGGLMSDQGVTGGDVWITPAEIPKAFACGQLFTPGGPPPACGPPFDLTPGRPTSAQWIAWGDNRSIYVNELSGGISQLVRLLIQGDPNSGNASVSTGNLIHLPGMAGAGIFENSLSATADRSLFVFASSSFDSPPEIFAARTSFPSSVHSADIAPLVQLSHFNTGLSPSWGHSVSLAWKNDSFNIQGWLLLPEGYDPSKKYPLIVEVHGGPAASVQSSWAGGAGGFSATVFSALGYFVLMANPRGSYGQGEAFTQANRKNFGYGDLRDILAGVDAVLAQYPVDPSRVGIAGWSYGGFMSMFAVTQTHRFRAAVDGAGISDWLSYYGENSIDQWMIPYFGASVYDDPQIYARSSAINFVKNVSTPTLIVVGDRDGECPAPQSFEFWHALRDLHVPVQFVVYPNEGHGFSDPSDRRDSLVRAVDWFAHYMPSAP